MAEPAQLLIYSTSSANDYLASVLNEQGYTVALAFNREELAALCGMAEIVIVDLPTLDELTLLREVRSMFDGSIIATGPQHQGTMVVRALDNGADDFVQRPFRTSELLARIRAHRRRLQRTPTTVVELGGLQVNLHDRQVSLRGQQLDLSPTEYTLLSLLALHPGRPWNAHDLLARVWGGRYVQSVELLQTTVAELRRRIEEQPSSPKLLCGDITSGFWLSATPR